MAALVGVLVVEKDVNTRRDRRRGGHDRAARRAPVASRALQRRARPRAPSPACCGWPAAAG